MHDRLDRFEAAPPFPVPFVFLDVDGAVLAREAAEEANVPPFAHHHVPSSGVPQQARAA